MFCCHSAGVGATPGLLAWMFCAVVSPFISTGVVAIVPGLPSPSSPLSSLPQQAALSSIRVTQVYHTPAEIDICTGQADDGLSEPDAPSS